MKAETHSFLHAVSQGDSDDEDAAAELSKLSEARHIITVPDFSPVSQQLRQVFDERFSDPRNTTQQRFLWDYWCAAHFTVKGPHAAVDCCCVISCIQSMLLLLP